MGGAKCGPGALAAGIPAFAGPMMNGQGFSIGSLVANAVIGGVASAAGGGTFANGAVTAAFGYLFNAASHGNDPWPSNAPPPDEPEVEGLPRPSGGLLRLLRATPLTLAVALLFDAITPVTTGLDPYDLSGWARSETLERHFEDHGADFGARTAREYAAMARDFFNQGVDTLPTRIDPTDGTIRIYDPATNTFGSYTAAGFTKTFFKPSSPTYFDRQPGILIAPR